MRSGRLLGGALLAALPLLVAIRVPDLLPHQGRMPPDRRIAVRRDLDAETLAARSRSPLVRSSYAAWYALARTLPGITVHMTRDREAGFDPLRGLGRWQLRFVKQPMTLKRRVARRLRDRATLIRLDTDRLFVIADPAAPIYQLVTTAEGWSLLLSREEYVAAGGQLP